MKRQDYIEAIRKGEHAIENDDTESLKKILKEIFPRDKEATGDFLFYASYFSSRDTWLGHRTRPNGLKSIKATELMNMKTEERKITPDQAQRIIDAACTTWKEKLAACWFCAIVLRVDIPIREQFYQEMRSACTAEQHKLFDEIFGTEHPDFKIGDFVKTGNYFDGFGAGDICEVTESLENSTEGYVWKNGVRAENKVYFSTFYCVHATAEEIRKAKFYPDGTPCWVRMRDSDVWYLRYADGNGCFYTAQRKSGSSTTNWSEHKPFDPNNLPFNE